MTRRGVVIALIAAELWQVFFGAFSSLQLGAPGVGDRASSVSTFLVAETVTLLPLGFVLAFWGARPGRLLAAACGVVSMIVAILAGITLSSSESSFLYSIPFLAFPGLLLLVCALRVDPAAQRG